VERAAEVGFAAIAITDHDTVSGVPEAEAAAQRLGLGFLSGVEISAAYHGVETHIVGLGIDVTNSTLLSTLDELAHERGLRAEKMIERLNELGVPLDRERVLGESGSTPPAPSSVGRMHIARAVYAMGLVKSVQHAFDKYIGKGRPAFVQKRRLSCEDAINLIHQAGGLAILCHPGVGPLGKIVKKLVELPFDGIEVYHSKHNSEHVAEFTRIAKERGFLISGGSDCHGAAKDAEPEMGKVRVPYEHYERLVAALGK
jgi:predicted metal-dependent phosphoesterase TrpH